MSVPFLRPPSPSSLLLATWTMCALVPVAGAQVGGPVVDYPMLTNTRRSITNFNVEVVRGFVVRHPSGGFESFAVNAYESTVVRHTSLSGAPVNRWPTVTNPVSVAFDGADLLVVGQGNHALARMDSVTGAIKDVIMLGSEPADIVVDDDTHKAYVSCMGDDSVWEVNIGGATFAIGTIWSARSGTHPLPLKRPRFLTLDKGGAGTADDVVYVAPLISGNNTITTRQQPGVVPSGVLDGNDTSIFLGNAMTGQSGLPDNDLFRITPATGAVDPVLRGVGSIMTAHGRNPVTGAYWLLNVEEHNLLAFSEPDLRGKFATNALAIAASLPGGSSPPTLAGTHIDLDDTTTGGVVTYQADRSVSFPYALDFNGSGQAAIGSSTTPIVVLMNSDGTRNSDFRIPSSGANTGQVVRTVKFDGSNLLAYCQQTSNILVFQASPFQTNPLGSMSLGNDPTPPSVKHGRSIWYDATTSLNGRTSCNTCHPQGGADGLVWQIANLPIDDKGPLVTQPLLGIEDTFPYHWRGERSLADFNGAFPGLLGTQAQLGDADLKDFEEFVFSLRPPANPLQDLDRQVKDDLMPDQQGVGQQPPVTPLVGSATTGLDLYLHKQSDPNGSCVSCHSLPTGSKAEFFPDHGNAISARSNFEVAHLNNQLTLKRQPVVSVPLAASTTPLASNLLGSGNSASGVNTNLFDFVNDFFLGFNGSQGTISAQDVADITAFVQMFDTGTAPAVHWVARFSQSTAATNATPINDHLLVQAAKGWVGVIARGTYPVGNPAVSVGVNWYYDVDRALLIPDRTSFPQGTLTAQTWAQFQSNTTAGLADNVFMGVPPGNEHRLGADMDYDGLDLGAELALSAPTDPWNPDSDGDGYADGYEVANGSIPTNASSHPSDTARPQLYTTFSGTATKVALDFVNAKDAKLFFRTNEPAKWTFTFHAPGYSDVVDSRATYDTIHSAVVQGLHPSPNQTGFPGTQISYTWDLKLEDLSGNTKTFSSATSGQQSTVTADNLIVLSPPVVGALSVSNEQAGYTATINIRLDKYEGLQPTLVNPRVGWVPILQVLAQDPVTTNWVIVPSSQVQAPAGTLTDFYLGDTVTTPPAFLYSTKLPGPFLLLPATDSSGLSSVTLTVTGLQTGQKVMFNVLGSMRDQSATINGLPAFGPAVILRHLFPAIPTELRNVTSVAF